VARRSDSVSLRKHLRAIRAVDLRFDTERDRRYTEVNIEREKALKIKETADLMALQLAREIQTYKDEKANELREQINQERGHYVNKEELQAAVREINTKLEPVIAYVSSTQGKSQGMALTTTGIISIIITLAAIATIWSAFILHR
jgi:hypothetical protein